MTAQIIPSATTMYFMQPKMSDSAFINTSTDNQGWHFATIRTTVPLDTSVAISVPPPIPDIGGSVYANYNLTDIALDGLPQVGPEKLALRIFYNVAPFRDEQQGAEKALFALKNLIQVLFGMRDDIKRLEICLGSDASWLAYDTWPFDLLASAVMFLPFSSDLVVGVCVSQMNNWNFYEERFVAGVTSKDVGPTMFTTCRFPADMLDALFFSNASGANVWMKELHVCYPMSPPAAFEMQHDIHLQHLLNALRDNRNLEKLEITLALRRSFGVIVNECRTFKSLKELVITFPGDVCRDWDHGMILVDNDLHGLLCALKLNVPTLEKITVPSNIVMIQ